MAKEIKLSATRIDAFLKCKLKYWFNYVDHLPKVPSPAFKLGIAAHESLELAGQIWKEKEKFTKTDKKKIIDKYIEVRLIGAIDKALEIDEDTLLIVDYKTSKTAPTVYQLKDDIQLSIYDLAACKLWPDYKRIILSLDMLRSDILYTYRTEEERKEFSEYLKVVHDQMVSLKKKDAKAHLNIFCPWCDYREYCDEYKKACKKSDYKFLKTAELDNEHLVKEWNEVRSVKKIIEGRERELSMTIMDKIRDSDDILKIDNEKVYIRQNSRVTYDKYTVKKFTSYEEFVELVNLNKKAVENYIKNNPAIKDKIEATARVNYTAPFLATKKIK